MLNITSYPYLLEYSIVQMSTQQVYSYMRFDFLLIVSSIGSILYTLKTLSGKVVSAVTGYSLDRSMMMRLYSTEKDYSKAKTAPSDDNRSGRQILLDNLKERDNYR